MLVEEENYLAHYGILRRSGRYPWGSGGTQSARNKSFLDTVAELRGKGMSEVDIARGFGITTTQLRAAKTIAKNEQKQGDINMAQRLKDKGYSNVAIGTRMGLNESSVRSLLAPGQKDKTDILQATSKMLKEQVDSKQFLDVGTGVEAHIGISKEKLMSAVALLKEQGYQVHSIKIDQLGTGHQTEFKVLVKPGVTQKEAWLNRHNIQQIQDFSNDGGRTFLGIKPPLSISSRRVGVNYKEDGGKEADGVIYVRPGVKDVSLGASRYAQVRILVDGTHYLKGMAVYKDDLPDGVDLVFNTNKSSTGRKKDAFKEVKRTADGAIDPDNPFGAAIKPGGQILHPKSGKPTSVMNKLNEEGDWDTWSRNLSSQFLSKQSLKLAQQQLAMTTERKKQDLDEFMSLTNPAVKKKMLESFADDADSSAVHLKAASLPRQASHVVLPVPSMKDTEVYAPNFRNGEKVVLIRYPHGGTFEIPELTVNNNQAAAKRLLGRAPDAIGIHPKVAERLSGADFDGDSVIVIPNGRGSVKSTPALHALKDFDPRASYPAYPGMSRVKEKTKQIQMGDVSNLITDMTIKGASSSELARAVKHSMVVIDSEKHNLDYKQSAIDNGIQQLKKKYQSNPDNPYLGAGTLISRAGSRKYVPDRIARPAAKGGPVDKTTGKKVFQETGKLDRNGNLKLIRSTKLAEATDAHKLSSGTKIEEIYANHSNTLKALANQARKEAVNTKPLSYSPSAKAAYAKEVRSLEAKLNLAIRNRPLERQAQVFANAVYTAKRRDLPDMDEAQKKRVKSQALEEARTRTGARKQDIKIEEAEWHAIQAGAITNHKLTQILNYADLDHVKTLATPKVKILMTPTKTARAKSMLAQGYTQAEVADALGVSLTTLKVGVKD